MRQEGGGGVEIDQMEVLRSYKKNRERRKDGIDKTEMKLRSKMEKDSKGKC